MFNQLLTDGSDFTVTKWNNNISMLENMHVSVLGRGVLSGLTMTTPSADTVRIADGALISRSYTALTSIADFTVPNNTTAYIWVTETGTIIQTATAVYPGSNAVCLGAAINTAHTVTFDLTQRDAGFRSSARGTWSLGQATVTVDTHNNYVGINQATPTAFLHLGAAGAAAPSLKIDPGSLLGTKQANAIEYDGNNLWITLNNGTTRAPVTRLGLVSKTLSNVDVTLTATEYASRTINLSGVLTGNVNLILPLLTGLDWIINNATTGAFTVTAKGSSGTGIAVTQGDTAQVYTDGTNFHQVTAQSTIV